MKIGTKVQHEDGRYGMVVGDIMNCCSTDEVPVVFDGTTHFEGTDKEYLTSLGIPEHKPDMTKCGAGKGKDCCIFLTMNEEGFICERFGGLRNNLIFKTMNAERHPKESYPDCMNQGK